MSRLFMGKTDKTDNPDCAFALDTEQLRHHMFVTGQSGCGKSSLVGRLVEEIVLRDAGHVLFLDYNCEFLRFGKVDSASFGKEHNYRSGPEHSMRSFSKAWKTKRSALKTIPANEIRIPYSRIPSNLKPLLLGIDQERHPGAYWLTQTIDECPALNKDITSADSLGNLAHTIARWHEGRVTRDEEQALSPLIHDIRQHMTAPELTRFTNAAARLRNQPYIAFSESGGTAIDETLIQRLFDDTAFLGVELLDFKYEHYHIRHFVVLHVLLQVWQYAQRRFQDWKMKDGDKGSLTPLFVVIDEAHNLAPSTTATTQSPLDQEVSRIIRTFAAEGRKFGLFLFLISQRPDKIDESVLSECDNFIIMRSTPGTADTLSKVMRTTNLDFLKNAHTLKPGEAFYCGEFAANDAPGARVRSDIKRTV